MVFYENMMHQNRGKWTVKKSQKINARPFSLHLSKINTMYNV